MEQESSSPLALALIEAGVVASLAWVPAGMLVVWIWPVHSSRGWWAGLLAWAGLVAGAFLAGYGLERRGLGPAPRRGPSVKP